MPTPDQCPNCNNYLGVRRCLAFGNKDIPKEIFTGSFDHTEPFEGDGGVRFEPIED